MLPNHSITFYVFLHWFTFKIVLKWVFTLSKISLLIFPESLFAGLISRHWGLFSKFSLWSLREIKASRFFFMHSIRFPIESLSAICFSSLLISEMLSSDPCLYVFVMLSCKSLLYVSSEVSYMFLILSAKTKILSDELIFFQSFAEVSWK